MEKFLELLLKSKNGFECNQYGKIQIIDNEHFVHVGHAQCVIGNYFLAIKRSEIAEKYPAIRMLRGDLFEGQSGFHDHGRGSPIQGWAFDAEADELMLDCAYLEAKKTTPSLAFLFEKGGPFRNGGRYPYPTVGRFTEMDKHSLTIKTLAKTRLENQAIPEKELETLQKNMLDLVFAQFEIDKQKAGK